MTQKVVQIGTSAGIIIPKETLLALGMKVGERVTLEADVRHRKLQLKPVANLKKHERFAKHVLNFVDTYRDDLEALSQK